MSCVMEKKKKEYMFYKVKSKSPIVSNIYQFTIQTCPFLQTIDNKLYYEYYLHESTLLVVKYGNVSLYALTRRELPINPVM